MSALDLDFTDIVSSPNRTAARSPYVQAQLDEDEKRRQAAEIMQMKRDEAARQQTAATTAASAAQQQQQENSLKLQAAQGEAQRPVAIADLLQWQNDKRYQVPYAKAPAEVRAHANVYDTPVAAEYPQLWNNALAQTTGRPVGTEGMTVKQTTTDPVSGKTSIVYVPATPGSEELTDTDLQRGQMLVNNQATIQQLFGRGGATSMAERTRALKAAEQLAPGWSAQNYAITEKARKDFTGSGQGAQNVASLNTIINHLDELQKASKELGNKDLRPENVIRNYAAEQTGNPAVTKYDTAKLAVGTEIAKLLKGTGTTSDAEIKAWQDRFNRNMSPQQQAEAIRETMKLIAGRVNGLHDQYQAAFGEAKNRPFLTTQSLATIRRLNRELNLGVDPNLIDQGKPIGGEESDQPIQQAATSAAGDTVLMTSPEGAQYAIPKSNVEAARKRGFK